MGFFFLIFFTWSLSFIPYLHKLTNPSQLLWIKWKLPPTVVSFTSKLFAMASCMRLLFKTFSRWSFTLLTLIRLFCLMRLCLYIDTYLVALMILFTLFFNRLNSCGNRCMQTWRTYVPISSSSIDEDVESVDDWEDCDAYSPLPSWELLGGTLVIFLGEVNDSSIVIWYTTHYCPVVIRFLPISTHLNSVTRFHLARVQKLYTVWEPRSFETLQLKINDNPFHYLVEWIVVIIIVDLFKKHQTNKQKRETTNQHANTFVKGYFPTNENTVAAVTTRYLLVPSNIKYSFTFSVWTIMIETPPENVVRAETFRVCPPLTGGNWQKWKRVFLICPCHEIYRDEAVIGLKRCKNTWKIKIFVKMWKLGQYRENLIFCQ